MDDGHQKNVENNVTIAVFFFTCEIWCVRWAALSAPFVYQADFLREDFKHTTRPSVAVWVGRE